MVNDVWNLYSKFGFFYFKMTNNNIQRWSFLLYLDIFSPFNSHFLIHWAVYTLFHSFEYFHTFSHSFLLATRPVRFVLWLLSSLLSSCRPGPPMAHCARHSPRRVIPLEGLMLWKMTVNWHFCCHHHHFGGRLPPTDLLPGNSPDSISPKKKKKKRVRAPVCCAAIETHA